MFRVLQHEKFHVKGFRCLKKTKSEEIYYRGTKVFFSDIVHTQRRKIKISEIYHEKNTHSKKTRDSLLIFLCIQNSGGWMQGFAKKFFK